MRKRFMFLVLTLMTASLMLEAFGEMQSPRRLRQMIIMDDIAADLNHDELFLWVHSDGTATLIAQNKVLDRAPLKLEVQDIEALSFEFFDWIMTQLDKHNLNVFVSSIQRIYVYFESEVTKEKRRKITDVFRYRQTEVYCPCTTSYHEHHDRVYIYKYCCGSAVEVYVVNKTGVTVKSPFLMNDEMLKELTNGIVPSKLKDFLRNNGFSISEDTVVFQERSYGWVINNPEPKFAIGINFNPHDNTISCVYSIIDKLHAHVVSEVNIQFFVISNGSSCLEPLMSWLESQVPSSNLHYAQLSFNTDGHVQVDQEGWTASENDVVVLIASCPSAPVSMEQIITSSLEALKGARMIIYLESLPDQAAGLWTLSLSPFNSAGVSVAVPATELSLEVVKNFIGELLEMVTFSEVTQSLTRWGFVVLLF